MENETSAAIENCCKHCKKHYGHSASSGLYCLGLIGAAVYFIQHAGSFGAGVLGILKAIVWPALVVYRLLEFLKF